MNVKDELLSNLLHSASPLSGTELADRIGCSRMAISKGASALAADGYKISVSRSDGYKLEKSDVLSQQILEHVFNIPAFYFPKTVIRFVSSEYAGNHHRNMTAAHTHCRYHRRTLVYCYRCVCLV